MSTLVQLWERSERLQPSKVALVSYQERLTYAEMSKRIRNLAAGLQAQLDVKSGDVVALMSPNCNEFVLSYFALAHLGAIIQPVDERLQPEEIGTILIDSQARIVIVHSSLWPKYERIHDALPWVEATIGIGLDRPIALPLRQFLLSDNSHFHEVVIQPEQPAELMYTSGTMGEPKAVVRSHLNVRAASRNSIVGFGYRTDDVICIVMPMSHSSALNSQMMPLLELGGTLVLLDRFDAAGVIEAIREKGVTCMRAAPSMLRSMLALPHFCAEELPTLRLLVNSSAPIDPQTYMEVKRRFELIEVMNSYGLTEASTCTVLPDGMALVRPDSIGVPIEGVEMRLIDELGRTIEGDGEGEICIRGEHVFIGYRGNPEETRKVVVDGWLKTGDIGHKDAAGYYYLHGRRDDVINCGGRKVVPLEVENWILLLPEVAEVAVVGQAHRILGQVVKAYVVLREGIELSPRHIINHCARNLASHKVPFSVDLVTALPKNSAGKVLRRKLDLHTTNGSEDQIGSPQYSKV